MVPGANYDLTPDNLACIKDDIKSYDLVMLQLELTVEVTKFVAKCAHDAGVPVMLNPAPAASLNTNLLACVTYLSPHEHEATLLTGLPLRADENGVNKDDLHAVSAAPRAKGVDKVMIQRFRCLRH